MVEFKIIMIVLIDFVWLHMMWQSMLDLKFCFIFEQTIFDVLLRGNSGGSVMHKWLNLRIPIPVRYFWSC